MFEKLKKLLQSSEEIAKDKRSKFRFDVLYIEDLKLEVFSKEYNMKEISLEGMSFFINEDQSKLYSKSKVCDARLVFKETIIPLQIQLMNIHDDLIGCKVVSNKEEYNDFIMCELSNYLTSYLG